MSKSWTDHCWIDGTVRPESKSRISLLDRGLTLGDGLFETMLWTGEKLRFFDDHMARLAHGATSLNIPLPMSAEAIEAGLGAFAGRTKGEAAAVRLTLTRGEGPRGLLPPEPALPHLFASLAPIRASFSPVTLRTVTITRNAGSPSARFKTLSYIDNVAAMAQARQAGADDGLMLDAHGHVACATSANVIVVIDGEAMTPPVEHGALPGIVRGRLLKAGLVQVAALKADHLARAETLFLTNALVGVRSVEAIDGRALTPDDGLRSRLIAALAE
jgi:branched-chain amino acid aminotransferase